MGWKLECEGSVEKSRFEGYTAAGTDLKVDESVYSFSKIGWMFVGVMVLAFAGQVAFYYWYEEAEKGVLIHIA